MDRTRWISAALLAALAAVAAVRAAPPPTPPDAESRNPSRTPADNPGVTRGPAAATPARPGNTAQPTPILTPAQRVERRVRELGEVLTNPATDARARRAREEAARQLAQRKTESSRRILRDVLLGVNNREAKVTVLRALQEVPQPADEFIPLIVPLLSLPEDRDRPVVEAAAEALAGYRTDPVALGLLERTAGDAQRPPATRAAAARALGGLAHVRAVDVLGRLLSSPEPGLRAAAAVGLQRLTGRYDLGLDVRRWGQWVADNAAVPRDQLTAQLFGRRAGNEERVRRLHEEALAALRAVLEKRYRAEEKRQRRPGILLEYLTDESSQVRAIGARIVRDAFKEQGPGGVTEPLKIRLSELVGDSAVDVRKEAALSLRAVNYAGALDALLAQLPAESDETVRLVQIQAVGRIQDVRSVPQLRELLGNRSLAVAQAAAEAIESLGGTLRQKNEPLALQVAEDLRRIVQTRRGEPEARELREAAMDALVPLRHPDMIDFSRSLLTGQGGRESVPIQMAALRVLGQSADPNAADLIVDRLRDEDTEARVRLVAVRELGNVGGFEHAESFVWHMDPQNEQDPAVREAARQTYVAILKKARSADQLNLENRRFRGDPEMQVHILTELIRRLKEHGEPADLAAQRLNRADALMKLKRFAEAIPDYREALDYQLKNNPGAAAGSIDLIIPRLMDSLLDSRRFGEAAKFGAEMIRRDPSQQDTIGPRIRDRAEQLRMAGEVDDCLALIKEAMAMKPPLAPRYLADLREIEAEAREPADSQSGSLTGTSAR